MIPEPDILMPEVWAQAECGGAVAVDFETFYTAAYSVAELGLWAYCHDPRFQAYLVAVTDGERTCVCAPSKFPWAIIAGRTWVSHHRDFDRAVFERLQELGLVPEGIAPASWMCSAGLCAYLQLPRDLAGAVKAVFGQTLDKGPRERAKGKASRRGLPPCRRDQPLRRSRRAGVPGPMESPGAALATARAPPLRPHVRHGASWSRG
ncbi:MAG: hypothetical protein M5U12_12325 [Verrucomicrobia bacterium]|nr:hypothetical protein [Verrucomicrobiota bacterium]